MKQDINLHDKFWFDNLDILISTNRLIEFIPTNSMNFAEKLNAIVRYIIYLSIVLIIYTGQLTWLLLILLGLLITYFIYYSEYAEKFKLNSRKTKENCIKPTKNNPFMNPLLYSKNNIGYGKSCPYTKKNAKKINKLYYKDVNKNFDVIGKNLYGERNFYTVPQSVNKRSDFVDFCYNTVPMKGQKKKILPPNCKAGSGKDCVRAYPGLDQHIDLNSHTGTRYRGSRYGS